MGHPTKEYRNIEIAIVRNIDRKYPYVSTRANCLIKRFLDFTYTSKIYIHSSKKCHHI